MPPADTPAPTRSALLLRAVLLCALAGALGGLAVPGSRAGLAARTPDQEPLLRPVVASEPVVVELAARQVSRATRSRVDPDLWVRPVLAPMNSPFGPRWGGWHPGIDFAAPYGDPVHVVADGVVLGAGYLPSESGYGQIVLVRHAGGIVTAYAHLSRVSSYAGEHVHAGDVLGLVGATGHVTGPHLHFEVRVDGQKVDPVPWLRRHGVQV